MKPATGETWLLDRVFGGGEGAETEVLRDPLGKCCPSRVRAGMGRRKEVACGCR